MKWFIVAAMAITGASIASTAQAQQLFSFTWNGATSFSNVLITATINATTGVATITDAEGFIETAAISGGGGSFFVTPGPGGSHLRDAANETRTLRFETQAGVFWFLSAEAASTPQLEGFVTAGAGQPTLFVDSGSPAAIIVAVPLPSGGGGSLLILMLACIVAVAFERRRRSVNRQRGRVAEAT